MKLAQIISVVGILEDVTRIELIDESGSAYVRHNVAVSYSLQDDGKTLKVFVEHKNLSYGKPLC